VYLTDKRNSNHLNPVVFANPTGAKNKKERFIKPNMSKVVNFLQDIKDYSEEGDAGVDSL